MTSTAEAILNELRSLANPINVEGMAKFGINPQYALGISVPALREIAKEYRKNHSLALELWDSGIHEARLLASFIDDPAQVSEQQMERWVKDFNSWDICDQCCMNLFDKTKFAYQKVVEWSEREEEFVKRAGIVLIATLAVHDKKAPDDYFEPFFTILLRNATDERNFVKKAVNWSLRQLGKRNKYLHYRAISVAREMQTLDSKSARWIAADALRELTDKRVIDRLKK